MTARLLITTIASIALNFFSVTANATIENVQLVTVEPQSPLLRETLVRLEAELSSLGFRVIRCEEGHAGEPCGLGAAMGRIELTAWAHEVSLKSYALETDDPLEQVIALSPHEVSAEVVAIRAVELLRGAMVGSLRAHRLNPEPDSALARFTDWTPPPQHEPARVPQVTKPPPVEEAAAPPQPFTFTWSTSLGPVLALNQFEAPPSLGVSLTSEFAAGPLYLGASVELAPWVGKVDQLSGTTAIRSYSGFARFGWNVGCGPALDCRLGLALGLQQLQFSTQANDGYVSSDAHHEAFAAAGEVQLVWRFNSRWGAFSLLRVGALTNAPVLTGTESVTLGQPLGSLSLGATFHVDSAPHSP